MTSDNERADAVNAYWNALARDAFGLPENIEPSLVATIQRLRLADDGPAPDPAFLQRLEQDLVAGTMPRRSTRAVGAARSTPMPGTQTATQGQPTALPRPHRFRPSPFTRTVEVVAAVGLVLVILLGAFAGRGLLPDRETDAPTSDPRDRAVLGDATPGPVAGGPAMFLGNAARTGVAPGSGPTDKPKRQWRVPLATGESNVYPVAPVAANGFVYVPTNISDVDAGTTVGRVIAANALTGDEQWHTDVIRAESGEISSLAIVDGLVFVGATRYEYDEEPGAATPDGAPAADGPESLVEPVEPVSTGVVVALDAQSGAERWRVVTGGSGSSAPAVVAGVVYVGSNDGVALALDAATGIVRWQTRLRTVNRAVGAALLSAPAVASDQVYYLDQGDALYALDARTGVERWRFRSVSGLFAGPVVAGESVFVSSSFVSEGAESEPQVRLLALDVNDGRERWRFDFESRWMSPAPAVHAGMVLVTGSGDRESTVIAVDAVTGQESWSRDIDGNVIAPLLVVENDLYVTVHDWGLFGRGIDWLGAGTNIVAMDLGSGDRRWQLDIGNGAQVLATVADGTLYAVNLVGSGGEGATLAAYRDED